MRIEKIITLEQATIGQVLAKDVYDAQENCLIAAGVILNNVHLSQLKERNIEYLTVCQEYFFSEEELAEHHTLIKKKLAQRFRHVNDNPDMCHLYNLLLAFRTETLYEADKQDAKKDEC